MNQSPTFFSEADLISRLHFAQREGQRPLALCIGSALTATAVPDVSQAVAMMRCSVNDSSDDSFEMSEAIGARDGAAAYQAAATFILARRGQEALNGLIRRMALRAHRPTRMSDDAGELPDQALTDEYCRAAERDRTAWEIPEAVGLLARMLVHRSAFITGPVLTTNFDPLLEIAVLREGGYVAIESLDSDGRVSTLDLPVGVRVVHLHGYWRQSDTLHLPVQLTREREVLQGSLEDLLHERTVLVIGYGGWDDIFTAALAGAVRHGQHGQLDVLWSVFEASPGQAIVRHQSLLASIGDIPGRVSFYAGVDYRRLLPTLAGSLGVPTEPPLAAHSRHALTRSDSHERVSLMDPDDALSSLESELAQVSRAYVVGSLSTAAVETLERCSILPEDTVIAFDRGVESRKTVESLGELRVRTLTSRGVMLLQLQRRFATRHYRIALTDRAAHVTVPHPRNGTQGTLWYPHGTLQYDMMTRFVNQVLIESNRRAIDT